MGNLKIVWIGTFIPENKISDAVKKGYRQIAANISQQYFINGIEKNLGESIDIISAIRVPSYPKYSDLIVREYSFSHSSTAKDVNVGFINIKYISHLFRQKKLVKAARKWAEMNEKKDIHIIVYAMTSPFLKAAIEIKKIVPSAKIILIVPDLPLNMDMTSFIQRALKKIDWINIKRLNRNIDKYILFTKQMADYLRLDKKQWTVIEGIVDINKSRYDKNIVKYPNSVCLYAGTLKKVYKIDEFTKAFINANIENTELHIYGNGDFKSELIKICNEHSNIKYMGYISSEEVFERMKKATLLVNPRPTQDDYTKYSCPSKTFEYMASGTPLLTTKLAGIPDEYFEHLYSFEDESLEGMTKKLIDVFALKEEELEEKGKMAQEFIRTQKNDEIQARKVLDFILEEGKDGNNAI